MLQPATVSQIRTSDWLKERPVEFSPQWGLFTSHRGYKEELLKWLRPVFPPLFFYRHRDTRRFRRKYCMLTLYFIGNQDNFSISFPFFRNAILANGCENDILITKYYQTLQYLQYPNYPFYKIFLLNSTAHYIYPKRKLRIIFSSLKNFKGKAQ